MLIQRQHAWTNLSDFLAFIMWLLGSSSNKHLNFMSIYRDYFKHADFKINASVFNFCTISFVKIGPKKCLLISIQVIKLTSIHAF